MKYAYNPLWTHKNQRDRLYRVPETPYYYMVYTNPDNRIFVDDVFGNTVYSGIDPAAAIQFCLDKIETTAAGGENTLGAIYIKSGSYYMNSTVVLPNITGIEIYGENKTTTKLRMLQNIDMFQSTTGTVFVSYFKIHNLTFDGRSLSGTGNKVFLKMWDWTDWEASDIIAKNFMGNGAMLWTKGNAGTIHQIRLKNIYITSSNASGGGMFFGYQTMDSFIDDVIIIGNNTMDYGIYLDRCGAVQVRNAHIWGVKNDAIINGNLGYTLWSDCFFDTATNANDLVLIDGNSAAIVNNRFVGCTFYDPPFTYAAAKIRATGAGDTAYFNLFFACSWVAGAAGKGYCIYEDTLGVGTVDHTRVLGGFVQNPANFTAPYNRFLGANSGADHLVDG